MNELGMSVEEYLTSDWADEECEVRCNNCMTYYESDDELSMIWNEQEPYKGCGKCETDGYLMDKD